MKAEHYRYSNRRQVPRSRPWLPLVAEPRCFVAPARGLKPRSCAVLSICRHFRRLGFARITGGRIAGFVLRWTCCDRGPDRTGPARRSRPQHLSTGVALHAWARSEVAQQRRAGETSTALTAARLPSVGRLALMVPERRRGS